VQAPYAFVKSRQIEILIFFGLILLTFDNVRNIFHVFSGANKEDENMYLQNHRIKSFHVVVGEVGGSQKEWRARLSSLEVDYWKSLQCVKHLESQK
jgi:hypothetical protein